MKSKTKIKMFFRGALLRNIAIKSCRISMTHIKPRFPNVVLHFFTNKIQRGNVKIVKKIVSQGLQWQMKSEFSIIL